MLQRLAQREPVLAALLSAALAAVITGISTGQTIEGIGAAVLLATLGVVVRQLVVSPETADRRVTDATRRGVTQAAEHRGGAALQSRPDALPEPRGLRRGLLASWPDDRDLLAHVYVTGAAPQPKTLNLARGLTLDILGNDRIGDCFWAALLHGMQCTYTAAGHPFTPTLEMAVQGYRSTGYDPSRADAKGNNPTDRGTEPRAGLKAAVKLGWITAFVAVGTEWAQVRQAIHAYRGAVILCWALPSDAPENGDWSRVAGSPADGHATQPYGYSTTRICNDTWGERGWFTPPFEQAYLQAAWAFTLPDRTAQPLVDHDALVTHATALRT